MTESARPELYPRRFREILRDYPFGERWIVREFSKSGLPADRPISETWEVCDRPGESSEIINGPPKGITLRQALDACGPLLLGKETAARFGPVFPLLVKLLDATHALPAHVHPGDELVNAWQLDDYAGKTEAWYMLRTKAKPSILCGSRSGTTPQELFEALMRADCRPCMAEHSVREHDSFLLYAGTMHYCRGGLLFYEIMQNSDVSLMLGSPGERLSGEEKEDDALRAMEAVRPEEGADCRTSHVTLRR